MTDDRLPLAELMAKTGDGDFLRTIAESVLQIIMEADVDGLVGAGRHERSGERTTWRNGYTTFIEDEKPVRKFFVMLYSFNAPEHFCRLAAQRSWHRPATSPRNSRHPSGAPRRRHGRQHKDQG